MGGRGGRFFLEFFFCDVGGGGEGGGEGQRGRVTPKPKAQVARFLVGMFQNRFLEAGVNAKVSPKVSLDQSIDEKVSPKVSLN